MFRKSLALLVLGFALTGCSDAGPVDSDPESTCADGKCDAFAPPALVPTSGDIGTCTAVPDTEAADDFFAVDLASCLFVGFDESVPVEFERIYLSAKLGDGRITNSTVYSADELDGTAKTAASWHTDDYPVQMKVQPVFKLRSRDSGKVGREPTRQDDFVLGEYGFEISERPTEPVDAMVSLPVEFWPVVIWPTQAFADRWADGSVDYLRFTIKHEVNIQEDRATSFYFARLAISGDPLDELTNTRFTLPVREDGDRPEMTVLLAAEEPTATVAIDGPGYYLLEEDGSVTRATPEEVEANGMFAPDVEGPGTNPTDPGGTDPEPTDPDPEPPADPCDGTCDATEACVDGACVALADQVQQSCQSTPSAQCDGEDTDCAPGHVCVEGTCHKLECQTQSQNCYDPRGVCDGEDSDCPEGHACADGQCVRLSCQSQSQNCYDPRGVCEEDTDCPDDHACAAGQCVRLSCQSQSQNCYDPRGVCDDEDSDCPDSHVCAEGQCVRLSCQSQSQHCYAPRGVCDDDDADCPDAHTCDEGACVRLSCM